MPRVIVTSKAVEGLERCREFLAIKNPLVSRRAAKVIAVSFRQLEDYPEIGRPYDDNPELRELVIEFGAAGYVTLYRYLPIEQAVYILAFKHQKELQF
jgi:plasmid stabilization system protein ParE